MIENQTTTDRTLHRVLVVEDESKLRESLVEGLRLEEWSVTGAASGSEARRQIEAHEFDLIVLDWMLPDGDGLEIVRQLRAQGNNVSVLMITARGGVSAKDRVLGAGATDFLAKPFSFDDLLSHSRALLRIHRPFEERE
jgi:two-component system, OmpR family, response regulator